MKNMNNFAELVNFAIIAVNNNGKAVVYQQEVADFLRDAGYCATPSSDVRMWKRWIITTPHRSITMEEALNLLSEEEFGDLPEKSIRYRRRAADQRKDIEYLERGWMFGDGTNSRVKVGINGDLYVDRKNPRFRQEQDWKLREKRRNRHNAKHDLRKMTDCSVDLEAVCRYVEAITDDDGYDEVTVSVNYSHGWWGWEDDTFTTRSGIVATIEKVAYKVTDDHEDFGTYVDYSDLSYRFISDEELVRYGFVNC